jgi:hypothetical protein
MTDLKKKVVRVSPVEHFSRSKHRRYIISIEPPDEIGVRLQGTRQCYRLSASHFTLGIQHWLDRVERRAKQLVKAEGLRMRSARAKARKELAKELKA